MGSCKENIVLENHGSWMLVDISTPKHPNATMAVDNGDFINHKYGRVHAFSTDMHKYIYAIYGEGSRNNRRTHYFHHDVITVADGMEADHITHGTMLFIDNRKSNLRAVTRSQNNMNHSIRSDNASGIKGVGFIKALGKWRARISLNNEEKHLGVFLNKQDAIDSRKMAELEYFGEYSHLTSIGEKA